MISVAVSVSWNHKSLMTTTRTTVLAILVLMALVSAVAADTGKLLVDTYGKLLLIDPDGSQQVLSESMIVAALSQDGRRVALTHDENPRAFPNTSQILSVVSIAGGTVERI